jgi:hypothetical protein
VEASEFEPWGRAVVERAAELVYDAIPEAQQPRLAKTKRAVRGGVAFVSRFVHFRHPGQPADRAVWLYAVPAGHAYDFKPPHARVGAGLMQDATNELDKSRWGSGLTTSHEWSWKSHIDLRYEGWRLAIKVDPETDDPATRADELAAQVLKGLRSAGLIAPT